MRLNRFLASAGLGSRRGVEQLIEDGRVRVNGRVITDLATTVEPQDVVKVGSRVVRAELPVHAVLFKPPGYLCTAADEEERRTIFDLLPREWPRVFHVGRLDRESEGLLIVTNDGDLGLALTHPRYKVEKEYEVLLDQPLTPEHREKLLRGFMIEGGRAKMESIREISARRVRVILLQGIKRQIRLMFYKVGGYEVEQLRRVRIGPLTIGKLKPGEWRLLLPREVEVLKNRGPVAAGRATPGPVAKRRVQRPVSAPPARARRDLRGSSSRAGAE